MRYDREIFGNDSQLYRILRGITLLLPNLNHPNIAKLKDIKKTKKHLYIIIEYCNGGKLLNILNKYQEKNK